MPSRRKKDGTFKDIVHPLNSETRKEIEETIILSDILQKAHKK